MTHLQHVLELVLDIRDCAKRARDLAFADRAEALGRIADDIEHWSSREERPSQSLLAANQAARATASNHFQETQRILKGIKR